ncbi:hypothetical protein G6F57_001989 [Rhizopus arrhizus]|uniref:Myb/SANT-like DNA-binding domain-containing protein n=1 Tax=Rhizopus oryzae TaxID=64495 RepID=A0A9P7BW60_RHIOR|nr:hypothetical protein G6F23_001798 [Rhizopus arrhizus]KAG1427208.1 hypothetical protein G6F58_001128 [Rhizopus delemar]KAG0767283.1 hypothetical protein G6F24_002915 [Rhizopus arrhizus]KAG0795323.1 hypothetical protein G6F21_002188 [Rhizopus arrhizus]KAG0799153.1 hypothetical protein G6F22_003509 [Rhizopus arrhizus]
MNNNTTGTDSKSNNTDIVFIHYDGTSTFTQPSPPLQLPQQLEQPLPPQTHTEPNVAPPYAETFNTRNTDHSSPSSNRRSANWDRASTSVLIDLYKESLAAIDSSGKQAKSILYKQMAEKFNNHEAVVTKRSEKALKRKWEELCNKYRRRMRDNASRDRLPTERWEFHEKMEEVVGLLPQPITTTNPPDSDQANHTRRKPVVIEAEETEQPTTEDMPRRRRLSSSSLTGSPAPQRIRTDANTPVFSAVENSARILAQEIYENNRDRPNTFSERNEQQDTLLRLIAQNNERQDAMLRLMVQNGERQDVLISTLQTLVSHLINKREN